MNSPPLRSGSSSASGIRSTSSWGVKTYKRQTSAVVADSLYHLKMKFPFRTQAIQIDGGLEFMDQFEEACERAKIMLLVNPPLRPQSNGDVERSNRTHLEKVYEVEDVSLDCGGHNQLLAKYKYDHSCIRHHRSFEFKTPYLYCAQWKKLIKPRCHASTDPIHSFDFFEH